MTLVNFEYIDKGANLCNGAGDCEGGVHEQGGAG